MPPCGGAHDRRCTIKSFGKMVTPRSLMFLLLAAIFGIVCATDQDTKSKVDLPYKIELSEGVSVTFPEVNDTAKLISFEVDTHGKYEEGRKKRKKLVEKFLPLFIMPFLIQSAIVPLFLGMLKFMLFKSLMVGKLALGLIVLNAFKNHNSVKGRDAEMADAHYGYHAGYGMEEYGALIN